MMVTFVSQCEKKALKNTRRVLDSFANRIGTRTWQTVITQEGLKSVKKLLRKTASKNSAIACHWHRSRNRSELYWIVGNRKKFNNEGYVPVNTTEKDLLNNHWENDWHYLPLIKSLVAMAGLFHDWGKASDFFQNKLAQNAIISDPLRHEWISVMFLTVLVDGNDDSTWLTRLADKDLTSKAILRKLKELQRQKKNISRPLSGLPNCAVTVAWLILSHHRLPIDNENHKIWAGETSSAPDDIFNNIKDFWGYKNFSETFEKDLSMCFSFSQGLPCDSKKWRKQLQKIARKLLDCMELLDQCMQDGSWRLVLFHSRMALMLADHYQSSLDKDNRFNDEMELYANTDRTTGDSKQKLTEHLIRVANQAKRNAHLLPAFEGKQENLPRAHDTKELQKRSLKPFTWQDKPVTKIHTWREETGQKLDDEHFGFFAVNMASTGKGKTFANGKIMRALSPDKRSLRYILALGLRTLTLQTGDEYRERIKLDETEVGVLIGSRAVQALHEQKETNITENMIARTGSESEEPLLNNEINWDAPIPDDHLATILGNSKERKFLYVPVLSCTIDHIISSTETVRGGQFLLPALRLMSSDLVIDEIDDFDGEDLTAIGRLIHLAGMLGRKVMISSATIPPDLAEGYFFTYLAGWSLFSEFRNSSKRVGCCWIDEFSTQMETVNCGQHIETTEEYRCLHEKFIRGRIKKLGQEVIKRRAEIWSLPLLDDKNDGTTRTYFYETILKAVLTKHTQHHNVDELSGKKVSFGLVRVANIPPCIELTKFLLGTELPDNFQLRTMAYHSQQLLIMRNAQEKHLDEILKRKKGPQPSFNHPAIRKHLTAVQAENVIFILVATPVEEVGRDHDFDWAVVEPSSYRSFIQLAGRVLRHQQVTTDIGFPNISLLQHNLKGLLKEKRCFELPGYESEHNPLSSHDLCDLLKGESFAERLDAKPRIIKKENANPTTNLSDLEHESIHKLLTNYEQAGATYLQGWLTGYWWLTALPQKFSKFRRGYPQVLIYLCPEDDEWKFFEKDWKGDLVPVAKEYAISWADSLSSEEQNRLWLHRDYEELLKATDKSNVKNAALTYGEISLPIYGESKLKVSFIYSHQLGLVKKRQE